MSAPVRTCIGCRGRDDKTDLLRLVWRSAVVADPDQREPGRGAYVHRGRDCLDQAVRRRSAGRALRVNGIDPVQFVAAVSPHLPPTA